MSLGLGNLKKIPISIFHHQIDLMKVLFILGYLCLGSWAQGTSSIRSRISVTLTAAGALGTFNPPSDCSKFSAYSTQTLVFGDGNTRSFTITSFRQGCQYGGPHTTCCPPDYELGQYNSPGVCPGGYTTLGDIEFVAVRRSTEGFWITYPAIGTTTGKLCCPSAASSIKYKADGPVPLCLATSKGPTITEEKSVINHESVYFGSAVIVIPPGATDPPLSTIGGGEGTESPTPRQASPPTIEHSSFEPPSQSGTMAAPSTSSGLQPQEQGSQESQPSGLSGGAIAGIAVGVSVPLILVGLYLAYRFGRRMNRPPKQHKGQGVEVTAQEYSDNGREGGVLFSPEIGGIRSNGE
ncbi:hypothetical protein AOL_s00188g19 [Orbilia oligospora ATCC 24927]|uniref:Mid2 domain-containing protein n=2 Tax=Orbilia oligospora TaxID=2813651 RepID=G1XQ08_ARTOA|nr:hypothetical protein AOL_s00188g19 [Orbilia oligospora ATCC 24927]EGX44681.1 hypothetical protein AOL_s00188g19 [Orbilia oligospora ATCC 24927]KAF3270924.1 hypothetical protein TWF970_010723 [Orbilia oligospora]